MRAREINELLIKYTIYALFRGKKKYLADEQTLLHLLGVKTNTQAQINS